MGNSASSEPLVKIAKRPLARSLRKNNFSAYEHELRIAVEKQLRADAEWCGQLTEETSAILREFEATLAVKRCVIENCVWSVYAAALSKRKLDFVLLLDLVQRLCKAIGNKDLVDDEQLNVFWSAAANFTEAAVSTIRNSIGNTESALHPEQLSALFQ